MLRELCACICVPLCFFCKYWSFIEMGILEVHWSRVKKKKVHWRFKNSKRLCMVRSYKERLDDFDQICSSPGACEWMGCPPTLYYIICEHTLVEKTKAGARIPRFLKWDLMILATSMEDKPFNQSNTTWTCSKWRRMKSFSGIGTSDLGRNTKGRPTTKRIPSARR